MLKGHPASSPPWVPQGSARRGRAGPAAPAREPPTLTAAGQASASSPGTALGLFTSCPVNVRPDYEATTSLARPKCSP